MSTLNFDTSELDRALLNSPLQPWSQALGIAVLGQGHALKHGHLPRWEKSLASLPPTSPCKFTTVDGAVQIHLSLDNSAQADSLIEDLQGLMPWRKGPYAFGPVFIDTEWRSDYKWQRLAPHLSPLSGKTILDVGCGSGYHLWRAREAGAACVLGIDPSLLYLMQFNATQHFIQDKCVHFLPLPMEALAPQMGVFDTVFSMGILYHRRNPQEHLQQLIDAMTHGGELVLETLVVPGDADDSLYIQDRYANMRNIYELPTVVRLIRWLEESGLDAIRVPSVEITHCSEQRSTQWMTSHSLAQALDPDNKALTKEGYPRPLRAIALARKS